MRSVTRKYGVFLLSFLRARQNKEAIYNSALEFVTETHVRGIEVAANSEKPLTKKREI